MLEKKAVNLLKHIKTIKITRNAKEIRMRTIKMPYTINVLIKPKSNEPRLFLPKMA